jgi:TetR/AcrR family transcriptional regulator, cholesterol catabolism regulator
MDGVEKTNMRQNILREAAGLFVERGVQAVSMREIAAAAGLSKPGLYYYFEDKDALVLAILVDSLDHIGSVLDQVVTHQEGIQGQLLCLVEGLFSLTPEERAVMHFATRELKALALPVRQEFARQYRQKFIDPIAAILAGGMQRGELRRMELSTATWALLGLLYPFFFPEVEVMQGQSGGAGAELVELFLHGMGENC